MCTFYLVLVDFIVMCFTRVYILFGLGWFYCDVLNSCVHFIWSLFGFIVMCLTRVYILFGLGWFNCNVLNSCVHFIWSWLVLL